MKNHFTKLYSCAINCIKSEEDYTAEELEKLYAGEGVPCEWDEDGESTAWDYINESIL